MEATLWLMGTTSFAGWLAEQIAHTSVATLYGAAVGFAWGAYKWRRWQQ
jgi:hypothetical protein